MDSSKDRANIVAAFYHSEDPKEKEMLIENLRHLNIMEENRIFFAESKKLMEHKNKLMREARNGQRPFTPKR